MNYFKIEAVSNSDLKELKRSYYADDPIDQGNTNLRFGSLVDAMLTWRKGGRISKTDLTICKDGEELSYSLDEWELAEAMVKQAKADPVIKYFIENGIGQHVFVRTLPFSHDGEDYAIKGKCMFDTIAKRISTGGDYKTTSCTTQKQFIEAVAHFDYDQQGAWYLDLGRINRHWMLGISKKNERLFKVAIDRETEFYRTGLAKYTFWGYRWVTLVDSFHTINH